MGKINVYDKIMIENQRKRENMEIKEILHKSQSKKLFRNQMERWNLPYIYYVNRTRGTQVVIKLDVTESLQAKQKVAYIVHTVITKAKKV